jgi:hypothetical protein
MISLLRHWLPDQSSANCYQDLRGKLTVGVQEAIVSGREQIRFAEEQVREARRAQELSDARLRNNITTSASEVLLSLQWVSLAQAT